MQGNLALQSCSDKLEKAITQRHPSQSEKLPTPIVLEVKPDYVKELDIINQRAEQLNELECKVTLHGTSSAISRILLR